jgi:hypothetical protein
MVAPPSLLEKLQLQQTKSDAEKRQQELLEQNKARAKLLLLSVLSHQSESYSTIKTYR